MRMRVRVKLAQDDVVDLFKNLRITRGMSQSDVAQALNVDTSVIGKFETKERFIGDTTLIKLARLFGLRPGYVFDKLADEPPSKSDITLEAEELARKISNLPPIAKDHITNQIWLLERLRLEELGQMPIIHTPLPPAPDLGEFKSEDEKQFGELDKPRKVRAKSKRSRKPKGKEEEQKERESLGQEIAKP